jgi:guanyl-specific ribonuclease Sa
MKSKRFIFLLNIILAVLSTACLGISNGSQVPATVNETQSSGANQMIKSNLNSTALAPQNSGAKKNNDDCRSSAKITGRKLVTKQTFPFDFKPFEKSCFVTFANPEEMVDETDLPRGSEFYIFREGKQIFQFPDAFDNTSGCWIEGVSFEDLNDDNLTDVIVAGKCLAAKDSYNQNAVYVNTGTGFTTNNQANSKLENFDKAKDIVNFVKKNRKLFF